jgi:cell wall-associated NlpC family hydrolase
MTVILPASDAVDRSVTAWRPDLAAESLRGVLPADRYVVGQPQRAGRGTVPIRAIPDATAPATSELLFGESFAVYDRGDGWAWGQAGGDRYVGWVETASLAEAGTAPNRYVAALRAFVYPAPDLKRPPLDALSLASPVEATGEEERGYVRIARGGEPWGWIAAAALSALDAVEPDMVATAERFLGVPYLWGGRSSLGLDCSGLVQIAARLAGHMLDRDTRRQVKTAGRLVGDGPDTPRRRGDLVFFPGHVGLMRDETTMVHATAAGHRVRIEPVADVAARAAGESGRGIVAVRRL